MKRVLLMLTLWVGAFIAHAEINQLSPSMPGQQLDPGTIGNGANPGIAPLPDTHKEPGLGDNDNATDDNDPYNNDPNNINNEPGSEGDLDSGDATTPTAQAS